MVCRVLTEVSQTYLTGVAGADITAKTANGKTPAELGRASAAEVHSGGTAQHDAIVALLTDLEAAKVKKSAKAGRSGRRRSSVVKKGMANEVSGRGSRSGSLVQNSLISKRSSASLLQHCTSAPPARMARDFSSLGRFDASPTSRERQRAFVDVQ